MTFEQAVSRLEQLVREMESGRMGLDESLAAFEEGSALVRFCGERLSAAEKTVQRLVAEMGGSFRLEPFEEGEDGEA
jgi:exodeoxyribonuclease VII small subunit